MRKTACVIIASLLCGIPPVLAGGIGQENLQYQAEILASVKAGVLYQLPLNADILQRTSADQSDIRLFGQDKKEIPYVIIENRRPEEKEELYTLTITGYEEKKDHAVITAQLPERFLPIAVLELTIQNRDFKKNVTVYSSSDKKKWNEVAKDVIYDFSSRIDLRKTAVQLAEKTQERYFKIVVTDVQATGGAGNKVTLKYEGLEFSVDGAKTGRLRIDLVRARTTVKKSENVVYDDMAFPAFSRSVDKNGNTVITLDASVPLDIMLFEISTLYYYRTINIYSSDTGKDDSYTLAGQGVVYSFPLAGIHEAKTHIDCRHQKKRFYRIVIENKNSPELDIKTIRAQWVRKSLFFMPAEDSPALTIGFGSAASIEKPQYDLVNFVNQSNWFQQKSDILDAAEIRQTPGYKPAGRTIARTVIEKWIFIGVVVALIVILGAWLFRLIEKASKKENKPR